MLIRRRITYRDEVVDIKYFTRTDKPKLDMEKLLKHYIAEMEDKCITTLSIFMDGDFVVKYVGNYEIEYNLIDLLDSIPSLITFFDSHDSSTISG